MTRNRLIKNVLLCGLILLTGLGFALALPWLANAQGLAADHFAPVAGPCYATYTGSAVQYDSPDAKAIQLAVDAASPGDIVKVAGTCAGVGTRDGFSLIVYISKSITLQGGHTHMDWTLDPDPDIYTTTLDAGYAGRVVVISGTSDVTLDGLYITRGSASDGLLFNRGGGIWSNSGMVLTDSIVFSNTAAWGGAIALDEDTSAFMYNVLVKENKAKHGGGIYVGKNSDPKLMDVQFVDNSAFNTGGGMYNFLDSNPVLEDVTFIRNSAQSGGGMMNNNDSIASMTNVIFTGNSANNGGGMFNDTGSRVEINNAAISGNSAVQGAGIYNSDAKFSIYNATFSGNSSSGPGGVLYNEESPAKFYNSIIWNNEANGFIGNMNAAVVNDGGITTYTYSLVQGSGGSSGWLWGAGHVDGTGNLDKDPKFVENVDPTTAPSTAGNLRLQSISNAIDAGRNSLVSVPYDLENKERIVDGDRNGTRTVDMGAFERYPYGIYVPVLMK